MPADNRLWLDDDQDIAPCRPKPAQQNPKHSIPDLQARARMFSFKQTQLLAESKNLETEIVSRTEKGTEKEEYWDHGLEFISYLTRSGGRAKSMIPHIYGVLATNNSIDGQMRSPDCRETSGGILVTFEKGSTQPIPLFLQAPSEVWRKPFDAPAAEFNRK